MAISKIALMVLSQIFLLSSIFRHRSLSLVKIIQREFFFLARPLIWMQDLSEKGVSKEMTRLQPGMSKPSSVTLVVISTLCCFRLNQRIFFIWLEYFSQTQSSTLPILEKYILAIYQFKVLLSPLPTRMLCSRWTWLFLNYISASMKFLQYRPMVDQFSFADGLDWQEWPSCVRYTFCLLAQPVTPVLLQKFFSFSSSLSRQLSSTNCRNLTVLRLKANTSTMSVTHCFQSQSADGLRMFMSWITFWLMNRFSHFPYSSSKTWPCFLSRSRMSFSSCVFSAFLSPSKLPSSLIMARKPSVNANSPSSSHRSLNFMSRHSLISQKRQSSASLIWLPSTSTLRHSCFLAMSSMTSCTHWKYLGKCVLILSQEVLWSLWRQKKVISCGINSRYQHYWIYVISMAVWLVTMSPKGYTAKLESKFMQSFRSSSMSWLWFLNGCETGEAVRPMMMGSRSFSSNRFKSSNFLFFLFCSKQNSFMMPAQGWSPLLWWHSSNTMKEQSVILMQPRLRQFRNIWEIITVMVAFFISSRKVLREVMQLQIRFRLVMVWSQFFSPWMQTTWLLRSSTFQFSWMY